MTYRGYPFDRLSSLSAAQLAALSPWQHEATLMAERHQKLFGPIDAIAAAMDRLNPRITTPQFGYLTDIERIAKAMQPWQEQADKISKYIQYRDIPDYGARFRVPVNSELMRAASELYTLPPGMSEFEYARVKHSIIDAAIRIDVPWLDRLNPTASLAAFSGLASLREEIGREHPFGHSVTDAMRRALGDWRGVSFDPLLALQTEARLAFYEQVGLNTSLTDFPVESYPAVLRESGLGDKPEVEMEAAEWPADLPPPPPEMVKSYRLVTGIEVQLRLFIEISLVAVAGASWLKHRVPGSVRLRWEQRRDEARDRGEVVQPLIAYADFTDYVDVIIEKRNWDDAFQPIFRRKTFVQESFERLKPNRNITMHIRGTLESADLLLLRCEVEQIWRAIRPTLKER